MRAAALVWRWLVADSPLPDDTALASVWSEAPRGGAKWFAAGLQGTTAAPLASERKGVKRGNREQITHTLPVELLASIDRQARGRGMTRAGFINFAISRALEELGGRDG